MIRVKGWEEEIPSSPAISILNSLQKSRVPIETLCGGRARCGRCMIRILKGEGMMSPMNEAEKRRLGALGAGVDMRLACQSYTRGIVEIEIINTGKEPA